MQIRWFIGLALLAVLPCRGAEDIPLSVTDAIKTALRRNHELARAALATAGGEIGVASAESEFAPSLLPRGGITASSSSDTWSYGLAVSKKLPMGAVIRISGGARRTNTDDDLVVERVESAVEIRQPLFRNFGTLVQLENVRLADSRLRQTRRDFELQKQDLVLEVIATFDTLIRLQRLLEANESFRERAEQFYKLTGIRERQGRASRVATLRAELQKGQADARVANSRERLFSTRRRFAELLGYDPETEFVLASAPALDLDVPEIPEAVRIALENRLDYAQVLQDLTDRERAQDIAQRVRLPEFSVISRYSRFGEGDSLSDAVDLDDDGWFVGIATDTDYNIARNRSTIGRARVNVQSAEQTVRILELSIARQVQQQVAAYQRAQVEKTIAARNLKLAEDRAELARRLFKVGRGDNFAVTDAEDAFVQARNLWLIAESEASLSGYRVLRVLGTLVETPDGLKPDHTPVGLVKARGIVGVALVLALAGAAAIAFRSSPVALDEVEVTRDAFSVWSVYEGKLEARRVEVLMSRLSGSATVVELIPEGATVSQGDQLLRFDDSVLRRELLKLERDHALAQSTSESLEQATLPLELQDLKISLMEAENAYQTEVQFLIDSAELLADGLISESEMTQQQAKVDQLKARVEGYRQQKLLTEKFLHPAERARARATLEAAEQELGLAREQLEACVMRAPASGMVAYHPLHIGTEYRTVRVGDTIFKNQPLITIPDMTDIVVDCQVPEAELSRVAPGAQVTVVPVAYPDVRLVGGVQTVSSVAQRMPDHPAWQKFFRVVIALEESEGRLRSGMSVYAQVLSHHREDAVLVPRTAITWSGDQPTCRLRGLAGPELRTLELGKANTTHYEVLAGLEPGDRVLTP